MELIYGPFISKAQAKAQGLKRYFDGEPCRHGHLTGRRMCDDDCVTCRQQWWQQQYQKLKQNPDYVEASLRRSGLYNKANPKKYRASATKCTRNKRRNDPEYRLLGILRGRVGAALRGVGAKRAARTSELVGCTIPELRSHLQAMFQPGMTWENHARDGWHIDHIKPCALFDLTDPAQQRECFHYTNLQPLWAADNHAKKDKWKAA